MKTNQRLIIGPLLFVSFWLSVNSAQAAGLSLGGFAKSQYEVGGAVQFTTTLSALAPGGNLAYRLVLGQTNSSYSKNDEVQVCQDIANGQLDPLAEVDIFWDNNSLVYDTLLFSDSAGSLVKPADLRGNINGSSQDFIFSTTFQQKGTAKIFAVLISSIDYYEGNAQKFINDRTENICPYAQSMQSKALTIGQAGSEDPADPNNPNGGSGSGGSDKVELTYNPDKLKSGIGSLNLGTLNSLFGSGATPNFSDIPIFQRIIDIMLMLAGLFFVIAVIYSGILLLTASDEETAVKAKKNLTWAVIGALLVLTSTWLINTIIHLFT